MPVLENHSETTFGVRKYTGRITKILDVPFGSIHVSRVGTGRRPKPDTLSPTSYARRAWNFSGTTGRITSTYPNPVNDMVEEGALNDGWVLNQGFQAYGNDLLDSNLADLAILRALTKLDQRDVDLGTAWKERGETAQLVGDLAVKAAHVLKALTKKNWGALRNELGVHGNVLDGGSNVVDGYLAYRYGVMPAMKDVAGAVQALGRLPPDEWAVSVRATERFKSNQTKEVGLGTENPFTCRSVLERRCRAIITATPLPITQQQDVLWSLGLDNLAGTIYNVIPYTFVLDWVLPISDWLSGLNALKYYSGWTTVTSNKTDERVTVSGASTNYNGGSIQSTAAGQYTQMHFRRNVLTAPPIPVLPVKDPVSFKHMADGLSLLAAATKRAEDQRLSRWLYL